MPDWAGKFAGRVVFVHEGHEVGGDGGIVGMGEARDGEGARDEFSGGNV